MDQHTALANEFASLAERFCHLIEAHASFTERDFLREMDALLPALYSISARIRILRPRAGESRIDVVALAAALDSTELTNSLEAFLTSSDQYRKLLSPYPTPDEPQEVLEGCLATQLTGFYCYLKPALTEGARMGNQNATIGQWAQIARFMGQDMVEAMAAIHFALYEALRPQDKS